MLAISFRSLQDTRTYNCIQCWRRKILNCCVNVAMFIRIKSHGVLETRTRVQLIRRTLPLCYRGPRYERVEISPDYNLYLLYLYMWRFRRLKWISARLHRIRSNVSEIVNSCRCVGDCMSTSVLNTNLLSPPLPTKTIAFIKSFRDSPGN